MAFLIEIGEGQLSWTNDSVRIICEDASFPDAPPHGMGGDRGNKRWFSNAEWADLVTELDLSSLMESGVDIGEEDWLCPLMKKLDHAAPLTEGHVDLLQLQIERYKAGLPGELNHFTKAGEWLLFWMKWSVENCQYPVFVNL